MITIYSKNEISALQQSGKILANALRRVASRVAPGVSTLELDRVAVESLVSQKAEPAFLHYKSGSSKPYPASLCTSINAEIVHCVPLSARILSSGDIVSLDLGARFKGLVTDMAITLPVGEIDSKAAKLLTATKKCLEAGLKAVRAGATTGDIGNAIEICAENYGFAVVKDLVGHGVGNNVHEEPQVPNYGKPGKGARLESGMVIAIEPMLTLGAGDIKILPDGFGITTFDGSLSAHFEKTVVVTEKGCKILTQ